MKRPAAIRHERIPVAAGLLLCCLAACDSDPANSPLLAGETDLCTRATTAIHRIQDKVFRSPLEGQEVTTAGVVTLVTGDGIYLESLHPDGDRRTSEGLFLADVTDRRIFPGANIAVSGIVAELGERKDTQTSLSPVSGISVCQSSTARPVTDFSLPLSMGRREAFENMRIKVKTPSVVTDVYRLRQGDFRVAADHFLPAATEVARPGEDARQQGRENRNNVLYARLAPGDTSLFPVGTELVSDLGVLGHDGRGARLLLEDKANLNRQRQHPAPIIEQGSLRLASLNLQNYFNGNGRGGGFPTPRGAETPRDFDRQRQRLRAAISAIKPHVLGVMEMENDGFNAGSAAADFLEDLRQATGADWSVVHAAGKDGCDPKRRGSSEKCIGSDEITVGIFFRADRLQAIGPASLLDAAPFDLLNRVPVTQHFREPTSGTDFLFSVNHFKSKGGCPDSGRDKNQNDGQGCWNRARLVAARALANWLEQESGAKTGGRAIVMGDLNAYRMEAPIQHFIDAGYRDLTGGVGEWHRYSYVYFGESGTLDHALATPELARSVRLATIWNINAGWPPGVSLDKPYLRSSDHDPVIVDLRLIQSSTSD